jgi:hypothetical protein
MAVDYVLAHLTDNFLESRASKARFFTETLGISPEDLPHSGRYSEMPFADRILITYDEARRVPRFVFPEEGTRSLAGFERFLTDYRPLFDALARFELVYLSDSALHFVAAGSLFGKLFPQSRVAGAHALYPKGPDHLLGWIRVRARYDLGTGGLGMQDFLLLREGNLLYTAREHEKLYRDWVEKPFIANEIPALLKAGNSAVSFRTEFLEHSYPIFGYRHLPQKAPAFRSMERSPDRSAS